MIIKAQSVIFEHSINRKPRHVSKKSAGTKRNDKQHGFSFDSLYPQDKAEKVYAENYIYYLNDSFRKLI